MPYSMCPLCGTLSHLNVVDVSEWYKKHHPNVPFGQLVAGRCFYCWQDLKEGDDVVIRRAISANAQGKDGCRGKVIAGYEGDGGVVYLVKVEAGQELYFVRGRTEASTSKRVEITPGQGRGHP
jgi:hypothetical protein